jgi:uncharacterized protein YdiU (UPF0061 family)
MEQKNYPNPTEETTQVVEDVAEEYTACNTDYQQGIIEKLAVIPEEYLAHLYHLICLMAKPFEEVKPLVSKEILESYGNAFRKTFGHLMKKDLGINLSYQIQAEMTILKLDFPNKQDYTESLTEEYFDIEEISTQNNIQLIQKENGYEILNLEEEPTIENLQQDKAIIFDINEGIYLIDTSHPDKWIEEQARTDARNLLGLFIKHLPSGV